MPGLKQESIKEVVIKETDATAALDRLLEDVETVIEENGQLAYTDRQGNSQKTLDILIVSIETDEGVLEPFGVAEMLVQVHY
jgi:phosphopantetheine adenylyltransferase